MNGQQVTDLNPNNNSQEWATSLGLHSIM